MKYILIKALLSLAWAFLFVWALDNDQEEWLKATSYFGWVLAMLDMTMAPIRWTPWWRIHIVTDEDVIW